MSRDCVKVLCGMIEGGKKIIILSFRLSFQCLISCSMPTETTDFSFVVLAMKTKQNVTFPTMHLCLHTWGYFTS